MEGGLGGKRDCKVIGCLEDGFCGVNIDTAPCLSTRVK